MSIVQLPSRQLDYFPCRYQPSKMAFRGPQRDLDAPFIACIGGSQTYGKFVAHPFPDLLEDRLGMTSLNLGCMNAGVDVMLHDPFLRNVVHSAAITVLQIVSPRNMSNRFYTVHPRRNDRFIRPSPLLEAIYREVDFSEFNFTGHMLKTLQEMAPDRFRSVETELQQAWSARMKMLLNQIPGKVVLLWVSSHRPDEVNDPLGTDPWCVTRNMIAQIEDDVSEYVQVVISEEAQTNAQEGMIYDEMDAPATRYMLGPDAHEEVAAKLAPVIEALL